MHILPAQKQWIALNLEYCELSHIYPRSMLVRERERERAAKCQKKIKHMKISQAYQANQAYMKISKRRIYEDIPAPRTDINSHLSKWSLSNLSLINVSNLSCVEHTLIWQHITALKPSCSCSLGSVWQQCHLMLLWKDWVGLNRKSGCPGKKQLSCNCLESQVVGQAILQLPAGEKNTKKGKERKYTLPAVTLSDSCEKHSWSDPWKGNNYLLQYIQVLHLSWFFWIEGEFQYWKDKIMVNVDFLVFLSRHLPHTY